MCAYVCLAVIADEARASRSVRTSTRMVMLEARLPSASGAESQPAWASRTGHLEKISINTCINMLALARELPRAAIWIRF